jgi:hypothetical protein
LERLYEIVAECRTINASPAVSIEEIPLIGAGEVGCGRRADIREAAMVRSVSDISGCR